MNLYFFFAVLLFAVIFACVAEYGAQMIVFCVTDGPALSALYSILPHSQEGASMPPIPCSTLLTLTSINIILGCAAIVGAAFIVIIIGIGDLVAAISKCAHGREHYKLGSVQLNKDNNATDLPEPWEEPPSDIPIDIIRNTQFNFDNKYYPETLQ